MQRRDFLRTTGATLALGAMASGCASAPRAVATATAPTDYDPLPPLAPIRARPDRLIAISVCTRPFRAQGPRIEAEKLGRKTVVHHYGHGGSGWSLSWGSARLALREVLATQVAEVGVIGCGAIGLTTALLAQRAGLKVTIYARERPPDVRSSRATGVWSPDSRYCTAEHATPDAVARWETMARESFRTYQTLLGLPGDPIEWRDGYALGDEPFNGGHGEGDGEPVYANLLPLIRSLWPRGQDIPPGAHPFPVPYVRRYTTMVYNLSSYSRLLIEDFERGGGRIETREFERPAELEKLPEKTLVNCTGYGARALFGDDSIVPVRGQIGRLIPQPEVNYGLSYGSLFVVPRRDGIVVQTGAPGDYGNADATPNHAESEAAVRQLAALMAKMRRA
ncbi:FAD-dependent oxidoreductase [Solimonas variicoloris]|uniref:FAD-dependent oxidoreductase n=1 Tax=Solimonas variicoloris TaxID=254408 RepID=UPI0003601BEE|nr:FAD-dependent oxidoreductase [Solimonas variicoloris]